MKILDFAEKAERMYVAGLEIGAKKNKYNTFFSQGHLTAAILLYHQETAQV